MFGIEYVIFLGVSALVAVWFVAKVVVTMFSKKK